MAEEPRYSSFQAEAMLCAWEWMIAQAEDGEPLADYFGGVGWAGMRMAAVDVGVWLDKVYATIPEPVQERIGCHDWEFVPLALEYLDWDRVVEVCQYGGQGSAFPEIELTAIYIIGRYPNG